MLGSNVLAVRLGGIYALQRLAEEHPEQYHLQIMQLFCAFARHPTRDEREALAEDLDKRERDAEDAPADLHTELRQDAQAVMTALSACHARQLDLEKSAEFQLDIHRANLRHADLTNANLAGVDLRNANLSRAILLGADLSEAELLAATLSDVELWKANLSRADLRDANLSGAVLQSAILFDALLAKANLSGANLRDANLSQATLISANLSQAILVDTNLSNAILWNANLFAANIRGADLSNAQLSANSAQRSATILTQEQLNTAHGNPPPRLVNILDAETGEPLVWHGNPIDDET